ncbi:MAG: phosphoadenosine phosphosulfate reductase [Betaproteobacteria bacterium TMED82]|nr:MAG: phosphoadenosine phosphosulfate reductase [Betaproteobacteria bacterium TMED82]|tara:strand:+ start:20454 stop:21134 length:681 start_codon:yes stop_codon:yes gene_type:complete
MSKFNDLPDSISILERAVNDGPSPVFSTSLSAEDQAITHLIYIYKLPIEIFVLDTGRLHNETLNLLAHTEAHFNKKIKVYCPDSADVENYVKINGINGFYKSVSQRIECCEIRKVKVVRRALKDKSAWITGIRSEHSLKRSKNTFMEWDNKLNLMKYHPLLNWSGDFLWRFILKNGIPTNPLHKKGFSSIGCAPCTRAVKPGEDERSGRWWWERSLINKECGLHED